MTDERTPNTHGDVLDDESADAKELREAEDLRKGLARSFGGDPMAEQAVGEDLATEELETALFLADKEDPPHGLSPQRQEAVLARILENAPRTGNGQLHPGPQRIRWLLPVSLAGALAASVLLLWLLLPGQFHQVQWPAIPGDLLAAQASALTDPGPGLRALEDQMDVYRKDMLAALEERL